LRKGQPLTVCNGIAGPEVVAGRYYSPGDCYRLEKARYLKSEAAAKRLFQFWGGYTVWQQAVFIDFIRNKGETALVGSSLLRKANAGDVVATCRENTRWNVGTVNGVKTVLPGLKTRGDANGGLGDQPQIVRSHVIATHAASLDHIDLTNLVRLVGETGRVCRRGVTLFKFHWPSVSVIGVLWLHLSGVLSGFPQD